MIKNCMTNCMTSKEKKHVGNHPHLYLRGQIFYCRIELPSFDGKRRFKSFSLQTSNYFEARLRMVNTDDIDVIFSTLNNLYNQLCWENKIVIKTNGQKVSISVLSQYNDPDLLRKVEKTYWECYDPDIDKKIEENEDKATQIYYHLSGQSSPENYDGWMEQARDFRRTADKLRIYQSHLQKVKDVLPRIQEILEPERSVIQTVSVAKPTSPTLIIRDILQKVQDRDNNVPEVQKREQSILTKILDVVDLTLDDDYSKFHSVENINKITSYIQDLPVRNDGKRERITCLSKIVNYVCTLYPDFYKNNILMALPKLPRTASHERKPHLGYTKDELRNIFNPQHNFFIDDPKGGSDVFWACMIALFTGARKTASITLQYSDFPIVDGIQCISFNKNHPIKKMKNNASIRIIPIHSKLIEMGFLDYKDRHKKERNASDEDFIFPKCQTRNGEPNNHFFRYLPEFLKSIGIEPETEEGTHDFHSFRKNINLAFIDAQVDPTYVQQIIGWDGDTVREKYYSKHKIPELQRELEKLHYDFLEPAFAEWKKIMATK